MGIVNDDRIVQFFRDEHGRLARGAQGIDHDIVREDVELLLFLALDVHLARQADTIDKQLMNYRDFPAGDMNLDLQVDETRLPDIRSNELRRCLDGREEERQVTGRSWTEANLIA